MAGGNLTSSALLPCSSTVDGNGSVRLVKLSTVNKSMDVYTRDFLAFLSCAESS